MIRYSSDTYREVLDRYQCRIRIGYGTSPILKYMGFIC